MEFIVLDLMIKDVFDAIDEYYNQLKGEYEGYSKNLFINLYNLRERRDDMTGEFHEILRQYTRETEHNPYYVHDISDEDKERLIDDVYQFIEDNDLQGLMMSEYEDYFAPVYL